MVSCCQPSDRCLLLLQTCVQLCPALLLGCQEAHLFLSYCQALLQRQQGGITSCRPPGVLLCRICFCLRRCRRCLRSIKRLLRRLCIAPRCFHHSSALVCRSCGGTNRCLQSLR